jgi:hypothetical protein
LWAGLTEAALRRLQRLKVYYRSKISRIPSQRLGLSR